MISEKRSQTCPGRGQQRRAVMDVADSQKWRIWLDCSMAHRFLDIKNEWLSQWFTTTQRCPNPSLCKMDVWGMLEKDWCNPGGLPENRTREPDPCPQVSPAGLPDGVSYITALVLLRFRSHLNVLQSLGCTELKDSFQSCCVTLPSPILTSHSVVTAFNSRAVKGDRKRSSTCTPLLVNTLVCGNSCDLTEWHKD